jgi:hypothetical protein
MPPRKIKKALSNFPTRICAEKFLSATGSNTVIQLLRLYYHTSVYYARTSLYFRDFTQDYYYEQTTWLIVNVSGMTSSGILELKIKPRYDVLCCSILNRRKAVFLISASRIRAVV